MLRGDLVDQAELKGLLPEELRILRNVSLPYTDLQ
jgi:hypothetical protein